MFENLDRKLTGVVIDPGNGGADVGSTGNGITEKDLNLKISQYMYDRFKELGIPVAITRTEDIDLDAPTRSKKVLDSFGNSHDTVVISNHINQGGNEGAEVVYALRDNDDLSQKVLNNLAQEGQTIIKNYQRRLPSNPAQDYYAIIRDTPDTEAIIVEYGYADNAADAERLKNNYEKYAEAVVRAVIEHKGLTYTPPKGSKDYYTVASGDTLWTISRKFGLTVNELKKLNNLKSNSLTVGQILKVSSSETTEKPTEPTGDTYKVSSGDSLWKIAQKYGTTVNDIKKLNGLSSDNLSIGQVLKIPKSVIPSESTTTYKVIAGDSLWKIAQKFGVSVDKLKTANNLKSDNLSIGQTLTIPTTSQYTSYTVVPGDTLYFIAQRYKTSVDKIKSINNLSSNNLTIGQKLLIPN
ncbi:MAG TPA: hypothetical protein DCY94_04475 [Firmicutes bacterium]|nr:hypothetical protein [Bacillota bacterium]